MESTEKKSPSGRKQPTRTPVTQRQVLTVKGKEPGYIYRIVNDLGDRISQFQDQGYELVDAKDVTVGDRRIQSTHSEGTPAQVSVGGGVKGYVMRIKKEWYDEDQAAKQARVDEMEQSIRQKSKQVGDYGDITFQNQKR